ncbi:MAG TPA: ABC transporter permease subunit [Candidatus Binatia bacterium]
MSRSYSGGDAAIAATASPSAPVFSLAAGLQIVARVALWGTIVLLIAYPLVMVLAAAFAPALLGDQPFKLADLLTDRLSTAFLNTLRLGITVAFLSVLFGGVAALCAMQPHKARWIDLLMAIPFLTPPFLASLAWSMALGPRGYLARLGLPGGLLEKALFSFAGLALLMALHYAPIVYFAVRAQILRTPASLFWAAQISGASGGRIIRRIFLPAALPALLAGCFLTFAAGVEEYGTPLIIGNRIGFPVISTEIGRLVSVYPINLALASGLASILLALAGAVYFASCFFEQRGAASTKATSHAMPSLLSGWGDSTVLVLVILYGLLAVVVPLGSMLITSLLRLVSAGPVWTNLTAQHYIQAFTDSSSGLRDALTASFSLALMAAVIGTFLGAACARSGKALASIALIPLATPAISMTVGFIRGWNAPWSAWLPIYGSAAIVGLFYTAQYLPYAVQYARAGLAAIPPSYEWAARIHGASNIRTVRRIVAPLLWPHCVAGAILIFSISFRELVGSVLLRPPGMHTVATFILREFDQGSPAGGMALGVVAIAVSMLSVSLARLLVPQRH